MNTRNFEPSNVKDLSVDDLMNSEDDNYNIEISEFGYITNISGSYSDIKVDSYETALYSLYSLKTAMGISNPFNSQAVRRQKMYCVMSLLMLLLVMKRIWGKLIKDYQE